MSDLLCGLFRMRVGETEQDPNSLFFKFLQRTVHSFCQKAEETLEKKVQSSCPDPVVGARCHPFQSHSRRCGNKALNMNLVQRFQARGGGYVSTKDCRLDELGVAPANSSLGSRCGSELACRSLMKVSEYMEGASAESKNLNFTFDAAWVSEQHVARHLIYPKFPWVGCFCRFFLTSFLIPMLAHTPGCLCDLQNVWETICRCHPTAAQLHLWGGG